MCLLTILGKKRYMCAIRLYAEFAFLEESSYTCRGDSGKKSRVNSFAFIVAVWSVITLYAILHNSWNDVMEKRWAVNRLLVSTLVVAVLVATGCAKQIKFNPLPLAHDGKATVQIELTYDRNDILLVKLSNVPEPSTLNSKFMRYVLWVATPDRKNIVNAGQLRVDESKRAGIATLTPLRKFILIITAESAGDVMSPGPDIVFETKEIDW